MIKIECELCGEEVFKIKSREYDGMIICQQCYELEILEN